MGAAATNSIVQEPARKFRVLLPQARRECTRERVKTRPPTCGQARPNPSFEARPNGVALGPRGALVHDAPRGPSTTPSVPPQLER
jgi:hypothetical protein